MYNCGKIGKMSQEKMWIYFYIVTFASLVVANLVE